MTVVAQIWMGVATIIAVLLGPIFAIQIDRFLQDQRAAKNRKLEIFRKLLITRAAPLAVNHIDALNLIEAEFDARKEKDRPVLDAWNEYWNHLNRPKGTTPEELGRWLDTRSVRLGDLLYALSKYLKLGIARNVLNRNSYYPEGYGTVETEATKIRVALVELLERRQSLKVEVQEPVATPPAREGPPNQR